MTNGAHLIICHDCDLLQQEVPLAPGAAARCRRCGATLYRNATDSVNRTLALSLAAAIIFLVANLFPVMSIKEFGDSNSVVLYGAVLFLWNHHMQMVSITVFITAILFPAVQLSLFIYVLLPLKLHQVPLGIPMALRLLQHIRRWSMVEVFMLGILVSLAKIRYSFSVTPGIGLWAFGALTVAFAALSACFSERDLWSRLDRERSEEGGR